MRQLKIVIFLMVCSLGTLCLNAQIPYLKKTGNATQMIVNGKPFLMLAGEVNNSSGSHIAHMDKSLKLLKEANLNSVLVSVSWEIIEPQEGVFDFTSVDELLRVARENEMKLGILWFASWKNALSPYAPIWVLGDTKRFTRVKNDKGENTRILSPFCEATRSADSKAFTELMKHISAVDKDKNTIIVVQLENEVGVLGQTKDLSEEAKKAYQQPVPDQLIQYLVKNKNSLEIEIKTDWEKNGSKTKGTWTDLFGIGDDADLFFMAWQYSRFINSIAESGKKEYNIPMYANCWMAQQRPNPGKPGTYPSGGPILTVLDVWKAGAPSVDILAPDIYGVDFKSITNNFHRTDNPLFIPEANSTEGQSFWAFAEEDAICYSPFAVDSRGSVLTREYGLLSQLMPVISQYQGTGKMSAIFKQRGDSTAGREFILNSDVKVLVNYQRTMQRPPSATATTPTPVTGSPSGQQVPEPASYGLFIRTGENDFLVAGYNLTVSAISTNPKKEIWLKDAWEGSFENGIWKPKSLQNGDEAGFLRGNNPSYSIRGYHTNPAEPAIFKFKVVVYDK